MLNQFNTYHQRKDKRGFTIVEFIIGIGILSLVISCMFSILRYSINASSKGQYIDELLLNGRFGVEFIKEELKNADKIISSDYILNLNSLYPENIGFVIFKDSGVLDSNERYNFTTYFLNGNKLIRVATNRKLPSYPEGKHFSGFNELCEGVLTIANTRVDIDDKLVFLDISMGTEKNLFHSFKSCLFIDKEFDF